MNIVYLSCHAILEYEEMRILHELGHEVFSLNGSYQNPEQSVEADKRPGIPGFKANQHLLDLAIQSSRANIHEGFFEWADAIIIMHKIDWAEGDDGRKWLKSVVERAKKHNVQVIWRTIGQSHMHWERIVKENPEVKIIRYSPMERNIPGFAGEDALIRFSIDPNEYGGWTGGVNRVHAFGQSFKERTDFMNYPIVEEITRHYPRVMYGTKNSVQDAKDPSHVVEWSKGPLSYDRLKDAFKTADVAFYTGTVPASYTLTFIEMMMTGTPIVAIGKTLFNVERFFPGHDLYEIPSIIKNGENGFVSDSIVELTEYVGQVLRNASLRQKLSEGARATALELFNKDKNKILWQQFLDTLPR
jgi:hypothetical protein